MALNTLAQTDYWVDLGVMARLQSVLRSNQFEIVAKIPVVANTTNSVKQCANHNFTAIGNLCQRTSSSIG